MSDPDVTALLNRAAANTPPMDVSVPDAVQLGRRLRRRRQGVAGAGLALSTAVAAATIWVGLGGAGAFDADMARPAGVSQQLKGPVTTGGTVWLLGEAYTVAEDAHGWPQLLGDDGSVFLSVVDAASSHRSDGGVIYMGGGIRFWRAQAKIHFYVGWEPPANVGVVFRGDGGSWFTPQEVVSIKGPAGVVTLVSVPPDLSHAFTGLGLRTNEGVTSISP